MLQSKVFKNIFISLNILFIAFVVVLLLYVTFFLIFAEKTYPLSKLEELDIPHIEMKSLEQVENLKPIEQTTLGNTDIPFYNFVRKSRKPWALKHLSIMQTYIDDETGYRPTIYSVYIKACSVKQAKESIHHQLGVIPIDAFLEYPDNRFDECSVEETSDGVRIAVRKGTQVFALSYSGQLPKEVFLDELAEVL